MLTLLFLFLIAIGLLLCIFFLLQWLYWQLYPLVHGGGPYVPSSMETVERMITMAEIQSSDIVCDLGSGDGRIIFHAVKQIGCRGIGYEIDPRLIRQSKEKAKELGLELQTRFEQKNFWHANISDVTVVLLFQLPRTMKRLETKLFHELPSGSRIVSNYFRFPHWKETKTDGKIHLYRK